MNIFTFLEQSDLIKNYKPTPEDGKFGADLIFALQHHLPLTFLQKAFILTVPVPGTASSKIAIFSYLSTSSFTPIFYIFGVVVGLLVLYWLFRRFSPRLIKKSPLCYFLLTFPANTSKTAYATEQLFSLLHALAKQKPFFRQLLGHKTQYALEIAATREMGIRYILVAPKTDAQIISKSLLSYLPGMRIEETEDYLPKDLVFNARKLAKQGNTGITELKLANDFALPLDKNKALAEHDPIAYLTGNMTKLEPGESMVFQVITTPLTRSSHSKEAKHVAKIEQLIYANLPLADELHRHPLETTLVVPLTILKWVGSIFVSCMGVVSMVMRSILGDARENRRIEIMERSAQMINTRQVIINPYEQELQLKVKEKLCQPLFEVSLRLFVCAESKQEYGLRVSGFLASLGQLSSSYQSLRAKPHNWFSLPKSAFSIFKQREVSSTRNPILSTSELTDIYHFPYTNTTQTEDLMKSKNNPLPAPLSFKQTATQLDNVFAKNSFGGSETPIGQTLEERRRHTYIIGATGSGKTTLLSTMIYQDILNGKGVAVIDPHGQLVERLLEVIPKDRIKDVAWFAPDDDEYPIALNLLELKNDGTLTKSQIQKQKSLVASSLVSVIQKLYDEKYFGPRMEYVLKNTIYTALETPAPTLKTILDLLTNTTYRKGVVKGLENTVLKDFWNNEFNKLGDMQRNTVVSPITNKIGGLLSSPINYRILTAEKSTVDFDRILNDGKILLCDLSKGKIGEDESSFFGSLVIAKIQLAALARARIAENNRRDYFLYVDEFQNFATKSFSELVSEARKYHVATILAHQSISQIGDRDIIKTMLANVGTVICFRTANPEDEQFILPIFSPEVEKHDISNLPLYNFYMKISVGKAQDAFLAEADNFVIRGSNTTAQSVIEASRTKYAVPDEVTEKPPIPSSEVKRKVRNNKAKVVAQKQSDQPELELKTEPENGEIWW